ncbi:MAG: hypothetical protein IJP01_07735, partial [Oscillospiraceae bacterium]|nr:hypothetical protein [Oscillospiraceae bacterium]
MGAVALNYLLYSNSGAMHSGFYASRGAAPHPSAKKEPLQMQRLFSVSGCNYQAFAYAETATKLTVVAAK